MNHWSTMLRQLLTLTAALLGFGCTSITEIRTQLPEQAPTVERPVQPYSAAAIATCVTGSSAANEDTRMIEDYGDYIIGYAEFDDQGWAYKHDQQLDVLKRRLDAELSDPRYAETDFLVLVFIHGWHHNAHDNDCNVQEFRQMVRITSEEMALAKTGGKLQRARRVIGIYGGWRGESVDFPALRYFTVIDRRDVAERVAKGSVRQLFANLHQEQITAQRTRVDKLRTVVIGHSFGGLAAFSALSQGTLNDLTLAQWDTPSGCEKAGVTDGGTSIPAVWPDTVILINPAFEASRFEPVDRFVKRRLACHPAPPHPSLIVVTAQNDIWTGRIFTLGRSVSTLFEGYDRTDATATAQERQSNLHAVGFVNRYVTHELCLKQMDTHAHAIAMALPSGDAPPNTDNPVWVVSAPPDIVNGHSGFLYARGRGKDPQPYLAQWLLDIYIGNRGAKTSDGDCAGKASP